jgi:hypothetical protein
MCSDTSTSGTDDHQEVFEELADKYRFQVCFDCTRVTDALKISNDPKDQMHESSCFERTTSRSRVKPLRICITVSSADGSARRVRDRHGRHDL